MHVNVHLQRKNKEEKGFNNLNVSQIKFTAYVHLQMRKELYLFLRLWVKRRWGCLIRKCIYKNKNSRPN